MRGKRSKQYKKLMQQYGLVFGFREPYQVIGAYSHFSCTTYPSSSQYVVDAQMIQDADKFTMNLVPALERVLHGRVKPSELFNGIFQLVCGANIVGLDQ